MELILGKRNVLAGKNPLPFSSSSASTMVAPPPIGPTVPPSKGDSNSGSGGGGNQQQQTALALFNRYADGMKGITDFHPQYPTPFGHHNSTTPLSFNENEFPSSSAQSPMIPTAQSPMITSAQSPMINRASAGFGNMPPGPIGPIGSSFGGSRGTPGGASARSAFGASLMKPTVDPHLEFQLQMMAPPPIGPGGPPKGDSNSGGGNQQQQQAAAAAALALFNRYTGGMKGMSDFPSQYQSAFPHHNSTTPLGFNENEFPSLSAQSPMMNRASAGFGSMGPGPIGSSFGGGLRSALGGAGSRSAYANLMKQTVDPQSEFQIHNEDFPALPGSQETPNNKGSSPSATASGDVIKDGRFSGDGKAQPQQSASKRGIQTHPDGTVSGIPAGMLNDQFGMVGLLTFLRAIETDPSIVSLALGHDLTQLGLNLNAPEKNLYQTFGGPWSDVPCRPQDIDCHVPSEYMTNAAISDKLAPIKLNRYGEDLLFYLFYNFGGEMFQLAAAAELYNRDWRYHKEERIWLSRAPGMVPLEKSSNYERGTYYVFDPSHWRKVAKEMHLEYDKLEDRPMLPPQLQQPPHIPQSSSSSQQPPQQPPQ